MVRLILIGKRIYDKFSEDEMTVYAAQVSFFVILSFVPFLMLLLTAVQMIPGISKADFLEIAMDIDADGVHVGQSDIKGRDIRAMIGPDKILGISAGTVEEAQAAEKAGADYLGSGAVFGSSTKTDAKPMELTLLQEICQSVTIPVVAIGGINHDNILKLKGCEIAGAAVVSGIFACEDIEEGTKELLQKVNMVVKNHE
mgnify:FL=1